MFSGIVEELGQIIGKETIGTNLRLCMHCSFIEELKIDQSISHNGMCLTVINIDTKGYYVDVISESINRTNVASWKIGDLINLERSVRLQDRLDGHLVQGHVDQTAELKEVKNLNGSWNFSFVFNENPKHVMIEKGSICINGISLTLSSIFLNGFDVSIIPYTYENTNFKSLSIGDKVNIEFDVVGKYIERLLKS